MIAVPFINTMLNDKYRVFVLSEFTHMEIERFFKDWMLKDMVGWNKMVNYNTDVTIEFYGHGNPYKIKNPKLLNGSSEVTLPYPYNIDEFICDCKRCSVDLEWSDSTISTMNRAYFMEQSELEEYNNKILKQIDKL